VLGFRRTFEFEAGLELTLAWFREHWDDIQRAASFGAGRPAALKG
jgi:hypothetical protein